MIQPITPDKLKDRELPEQLIQIVNELIEENWDGQKATITSDRINEKISKLPTINGYPPFYLENELDEHGKALLRKLYENAGWMLKTIFFTEKTFWFDFFKPIPQGVCDLCYPTNVSKS